MTKCMFNGIIGRIVIISKSSESKKQTVNSMDNDLMLFLNFLEIDSSYNDLVSHLAFSINDCRIELNVNYKLFQFIPNNENENYSNIIFMKNNKISKKAALE